MSGALPHFLYFGLDESSRELLAKICDKAPWIELAPLDKGLSGSTVLIGRWSVGGTPTKFHVFKIGDPGKLKREHDAITHIAAPLVLNFPNVDYAVTADGGRGILSQEFMGDSDGSTRSLRQFIESSEDVAKVQTVLERLYSERIIDWIPKKARRAEQTTIHEELKEWIRKGDLDSAISDIGKACLQQSLLSKFGLDTDGLKALIRQTLNSSVSVEKGPVHGDLHAQNIIIDQSGRISLIDFGWTAIRWRAVDYLWLECSLKFVVCSPYALIDDLLAMEALLDEQWDSVAAFDTSALASMMHASSLAKVATGVAVIRQNARRHLPSLTLQDYRKGLVAMSFALTTFPQLNRGYLVHSIARNVLALRSDLRAEGPYHRLYQSGLLWPSRPGRMVKQAIQHAAKPGRALDVGCGDGKNLVFLEDAGWSVTGFDINSVAINNVGRRVEQHFGPMHVLRGSVVRADATTYEYPAAAYDLIVAYGLYHCLGDVELAAVHAGIVEALRPGGLLAFAAFNDTIPVPPGHETDQLYLRAVDHIFSLTAADFVVVDQEVGEITESHLPLVPEHKHGLTWALLKKK